MRKLIVLVLFVYNVFEQLFVIHNNITDCNNVMYDKSSCNKERDTDGQKAG